MTDIGRIVVVGGSLAGVRAAETLREEGFHGALTVIDADWDQPYDRYHLSKDYLEGVRDAAQISLPISHIDAQWRRQCLARRLDLERREVVLSDGTRIGYDGVVLATGSRARTLPPAEMAFAGVFPLRTLADARVLRSAMTAKPTSMVIVGGGLIGSEVASVAAKWGIPTTIVDESPLPLARTLGPDLAERVVSLHNRHGVTCRYGVGLRAIEGHNGRVRSVHLTDGSCIAAQIVLVCLGVEPNTEWLADSGLPVFNGVVCEASLFVKGQADIVAAGDIARWPVALCGLEPVRLEHWRSTLDQAAHAARSLLQGAEAATPYTALPVFGTHIHGRHFRSNGYPAYADRCEVVWGDLDADRCIVAFSRDDRLVGAISLDADDLLGEWRTRIDAELALTGAS